MNTFKGYNSARRAALHDIAEYLDINNSRTKEEGVDYFVVSTKFVDNKHQRLLNRELGLHKVNYTQKAMTRTNKI